nr:MAG TPA: hypothetical protein [Caudoviricetes sp.]
MFNFKPFPPYVIVPKYDVLVPKYDPNNYLKFLADSKPLFFTKDQIAITMEE